MNDSAWFKEHGHKLEPDTLRMMIQDLLADQERTENGLTERELDIIWQIRNALGVGHRAMLSDLPGICRELRERADKAGGNTAETPTVETAWLIEQEGPKWAGFVDGKPEWTTDPNRALRFARKEDADNFKAHWCATATSTSHMWLPI